MGLSDNFGQYIQIYLDSLWNENGLENMISVFGISWNLLKEN